MRPYDVAKAMGGGLLGTLVQTISQSPFAKDTLIIVTEDDCQDGPDHVDSHRATAYVVGPYVKRGKVVNAHYSQVNVLRTIEDILGTEHINLNTASQRPMSEIFDIHLPAHWHYEAVASTVLKGTGLEQTGPGLGAMFAEGPVVHPKHGSAYWARMTKGLDFSEADHVPPGRFNRLLWKGLMGARRYPAQVDRVASADDRRSDD